MPGAMSEDTTREREDDLLAGEYVLGVLPYEERLLFARRLELEPALQARVRFWDEQFVTWAEHLVPISPSAQLRERLERRLFGAPETAGHIWQSLVFWRGLSLASLTALVLVTYLYVAGIIPGAKSERNYVAEVEDTAGAVQLLAFYDPLTEAIRLNRIEGRAAVGRTFELWLIEGGNPPVSLGVLPNEDIVTIAIPAALKDKIATAVLAVSDEPMGGSPTGQPTGAVLASGKLNPV
jgi:anti-sigma-K factor RskA